MKKRKINIPHLLMTGIGLSLLLVCAGVLYTFISHQETKEEKIKEEVVEEEKVDKLSFVGVGDNIIHEKVFKNAKAGDSYDFTSCYEGIKKYIEEADLAYVNQETMVCGDRYGIKGYPAFNSPEALISTLKDVGFDLVSTASNHSLDLGVDALLSSAKIWKQQDIVSAGIYDSQEDRDTIRIIEKNNIKVAFLAYTYGINQYGLTQKTANRFKNNPYILATLDKEQVKKDVEKAKELSDAIVVAVHWGEEGSYELSSLQKEYAQYFASLGVNVVLGSHPHVIQKMTWIDNTLVAYSLGNFLSTMNGVDNQLEGMVSFDFIKKDKQVSVENVTYIPLINHHNVDANDIGVYPLKDYTKGSEHAILKNQNNIIQEFKKKVKELIPDEFKIEM